MIVIQALSNVLFIFGAIGVELILNKMSILGISFIILTILLSVMFYIAYSVELNIHIKKCEEEIFNVRYILLSSLLAIILLSISIDALKAPGYEYLFKMWINGYSVSENAYTPYILIVFLLNMLTISIITIISLLYSNKKIEF